MKNEALKYLKLGWSVMPLGSITKKPNGSKLIQYPETWKKYQTSFVTPEEVNSWQYENLGVITGKFSNLLVLDADEYKPTYDKKLFRSLKIPVTPTQNTANGGKQYFFKFPKGINISNDVSIGHDDSCIDIRAEGGMCIIAPTKTSYGEYSWIDGLSPFDIPLAEVPQSLLEILDKQNATKTDWSDFFSKEKGEGMRNTSATKLAGKILYETSPEMWDTLGIGYFREWNRKYNTPPLPEDELLTVWQSVKKTHIKNSPPPELDMRNEVDEEEKAITKDFVKNKTKGTFYLAKYLTKKFNIITVGEKEREMYVYRNGMYARAENEIIYPEIQRVLGEHITKSAKTETFHKIADMTSYPRDVFASAPIELIPLKNGVYNFYTSELLPHDPKYRFTYQFPIIFNPSAVCSRTKEFMDHIFNEEYRDMIQEWLGYYFYRMYLFKKAVIFVGEGDTGKTTFLETIIHLIGKDNISNISLHKMSSDKFSAAHLYEKHGNIVDELSARDISDTGAFKMATGGGTITGEYKFGNQFSFQNFSKFTFACNKIPDVKDFDDEAYFNRWMVVRFTNPIVKKIPNFIETLTTEHERSGLFLYAMEGLRRLLNQGCFSFGKTAIETKLEMMRSGSSIAMFAANKIVASPENEISKADMYHAYSNYCVEEGLATETMDMFGKKFLFYVSFASEGLIYDPSSPKAKRVRGWRNVAVNSSIEKESAVDKEEKPQKKSLIDDFIGDDMESDILKKMQ